MLDPHFPKSYPRRVLLAVTGLSPQVVTETLYALAVRTRPAFIPTEIQLITTRQGAEHARLNLLSQQIGWFHRLRADYGLPEIIFDATRIHVIPDDTGGELDDIRTVTDNARTADFITERVRALTSDPECALHVSIAGGRKTMGYYLGYALSLFGRGQDRLSHVLVSAPYENNRDFYYPTPYEHAMHVQQNGKEVAYDCRKAVVDLADIPFVRLREDLPEPLINGTSRFSDLVIAAQRALAPPSLVIELADDDPVIEAGGITVAIAPADAAFYLLMTRAAADGRTLRWNDPGLAQDYLREYDRFASARYTMAEKRLSDEFLDSWFEERKAKCNSALRKALGKTGARAYEIQGFGVKGRMRFGLALPAGAIHIPEDLPQGPAGLSSHKAPRHAD
jgi:CRISPR-associated protein (TIGR02584 family)